MLVLGTPRLRLRHLDPADAPFLLELLNDPEWLRLIGDRGVRTLEAAERYRREGPAAMIARHGFGLFAVVLKETNQVAGICGLLQRDGLPAPDLGFAFLQRFTGRGYAREAGAATLDWGRRAFGLRRILAITTGENVGSIRVLESLGMTLQGPVRLPGEDRDMALYAWAPPEPSRILILGNSGSGKSTRAKALAERTGLPHLDLDTLVWEPGRIAVPRPLAAVHADLEAFAAKEPGWIVEGCYGELIEALLPRCTELVFLNPGPEACLSHNRRRPWEPHKYATPEAQDAMFEGLQAWVAGYYARDDAWSLHTHRRIFDGFEGPKREETVPADR